MAPLVILEPNVVPIRQTISLSDLLEIRNLQPGRQIQLYRFRDNGAGGGAFEINGSPQQANVWHEVPRLQLASVTYRGGFVQATEGFSVQVFDGFVWSNVASSQITTGNQRPNLIASNGRVGPFERTPIIHQISYFDPDGDAAVRYEFIDRNPLQQGGHFELRGQRLPSAQWLSVSAAELPDLLYRGGTFGPQEEVVSMRVFDGFSFSSVVDFTMRTTTAPVIEPIITDVVAREKVLASTLFNFTDADGDQPFSYLFVDRRPNQNGGYFEFKGQRMPSAVWFTVPANEINQLYYVGGTFGPQSENVGILAYDGFQWSDIVDVRVNTIPRPSATIISPSVQIQANHYLNVATGRTANSIISPQEGNPQPFLQLSDTVERISIKDNASNHNGGHFVFKGVRMPSDTWFNVNVAELDQLEYRGGIFGPQNENIMVRPFGDGVFGDTAIFRADTLPNLYAPVLNFNDRTTGLGAVLSLESMITWSDQDGDILTQFGIYDTGDEPNSGYFSVNGVQQPAKTWIVLPYDQLHTVNYHFPNQPAKERVRMWVSDGFRSSGGVTANMEAIERPVITPIDTDISLDTLENVPASTIFQQGDGGPAFTRYEVFDENFDASLDRSARFHLRGPGAGNQGEQLQPGVVHTLTAEQFSRLDIQGAEADFGRALDGLLVRATNDITGWSEWKRVNVNTDPVGPISLESGMQFNAVMDGDKTVITFSFIDGGNQTNSPRDNPNRPPLPWYYPAGPDTFEALNPHALGQPVREAMRRVFAELETFANVDFVELPYNWATTEAAIVIGAWGPFDGPFGGAAAYAYLPSDGDGRGNPIGDIWFNLGSFPWDTDDVDPGSFFYQAAQHEVGHALGLKHPFEGTPALSIFNNYTYNSVMAYNQGFDVGFPTNPIQPSHPQFPGGYMLYDIAAIQQLYGANMNYRTGNDVYRFFRTDTHQRTIWDAGGQNTISLANSITDEIIDLRQGTWSTLHGVPQALRIAYGTVIQHAFGGAGDDVIIGNEEVNVLFGGAGDDTLIGGGGNDHLYGGAGNDTYVWRLGDGHNRIFENGEGGHDVIEFHDASGNISAFEDDFMLRRFGNNLRVDLTLNLGPTQGSFTIVNFADPESRVETLRMFSQNNQVLGDIDLTSAWDHVDTVARRFRATNTQSDFGFLLAPA